METKVCTKCGEEKPATAEFFYRRIDSKFGFRGECRICTNKYKLEYWERNRQKLIEKKRNYYRENSDSINLKNRIWREDNPEKVKENKKKWIERNPEKEKDRQNRLAKLWRENINDPYVKRLISSQTGLSYRKISPELIEAKIQTIKIKRLCRTSQN